MVRTQIERQAICANCQWNKQCIEPPNMTEDEVKAEIGLDEKPNIDSREDAEKSLLSTMMKAVVFGGEDKKAIVCPILADALRSGPEVSLAVRNIMQGK